eukprot:g25047.t1
MTKCLVLRPQRGTKHGERQPGARCALFTLSCINALNFADRYVPAAVKTSMEKERMNATSINIWLSVALRFETVGITPKHPELC